MEQIARLRYRDDRYEIINVQKERNVMSKIIVLNLNFISFVIREV